MQIEMTEASPDDGFRPPSLRRRCRTEPRTWCPSLYTQTVGHAGGDRRPELKADRGRGGPPSTRNAPSTAGPCHETREARPMPRSSAATMTAQGPTDWLPIADRRHDSPRRSWRSIPWPPTGGCRVRRRPTLWRSRRRRAPWMSSPHAPPNYPAALCSAAMGPSPGQTKTAAMPARPAGHSLQHRRRRR